MKKSADIILDRNALTKTHSHILTKIFRTITPTTSSYTTTPDLNETLAFYRASHYSSSVTSLRLSETIAWRAAFKIDKLVEDKGWLGRERALRSILLYDYLGTDRHGRPVMVERIGAWDVDAILALIKSDGEDSFLKLHCIACETLLRMKRPPTTLDTRGQVIIMDCAGLSTKHLSPTLAQAFGKLSSNDERHYPDTLAHIFVVNAPYLFKALSILLRPFMDKDTLAKVHVSSGVPEELVVFLGEDCLPVELGGSRRGLFPYDETALLSSHPMGVLDIDGS